MTHILKNFGLTKQPNAHRNEHQHHPEYLRLEEGIDHSNNTPRINPKMSQTEEFNHLPHTAQTIVYCMKKTRLINTFISPISGPIIQIDLNFQVIETCIHQLQQVVPGFLRGN